LEPLEQRLPPGDAVAGAVFGLRALETVLAEPGVDTTGQNPSAMDVAFESVDSLMLPNLKAGAPETSGAKQLAPTSVRLTRPDDSSGPDERASSSVRLISALNAPVSESVNTMEAITAPDSSTAPHGSTAVTLVGTTPSALESVGAVPGKVRSTRTGPTGQEQRSRAVDNYGKLPLAFEPNVGQTDPRVDFMARTGGGTVFLTPAAAVFVTRRSAVSGQHSAGMRSPNYEARNPNSGAALYMDLVGANPASQAAGVSPLSGRVNYFIGNDPAQWHTNIPTYGRVEFKCVYPGIDLAYYSNGGQPEYDFIVSPGGDPHAITLHFAGAEGIEIDARGNMIVHTAAGDVVHQTPRAYQSADAAQQDVASRYVLDGQTVRFEVGAFDATRPLVIDPLVVAYSTYLGGSGDDYASGIASSAGGDTYITGLTSSPTFPGPPGGFDTTYNGGTNDAFVAELNAAGSALVYATYLGGTGDDRGMGIAVDANADAYVCGYSSSANFPTTAGAFDTVLKGTDAFVIKLNPTGTSLIYGSFLGGTDGETAWAIAVDGGGNAYLAGDTDSTDFPTTPGTFDGTFNGIDDAFVAKLNPGGSSLLYGTFIGGPDIDVGFGVAIDGAGEAYVAGVARVGFPTTPGAFQTTYAGGGDGFLVKLNPAGSSLVFGSYLGGSASDEAHAIALDGKGNPYVTGFAGAGFPTSPGAFDSMYNGGLSDAFAVELTSTGKALIYGTYLGGSADESGFGIAVNGGGQAYITGYTGSPNFPITSTGSGFAGHADAFLEKMAPGGTSLTYGTYLGGSFSDYGAGVAIDARSSAYVTGYTDSFDFPTTPGAFMRRNRANAVDAFVTKFAEA
jgi:hypothetical protein